MNESNIKRKPFSKLKNKTVKNYLETENNVIKIEEKENYPVSNIMKKSSPKLKKKKEIKISIKNYSKIYNTDPFDFGILNEIQSRERFMMDTILRSAIINR